MPKPVDLHAKVIGDVDQIYDHIAANNPVAAERVTDTIQETLVRLSHFPRSGRIYKISAIRRVRVVPVGRFRQYLIFYKDTSASLRVLYILDGRRDLQPIFAGDQRK